MGVDKIQKYIIIHKNDVWISSGNSGNINSTEGKLKMLEN